MGIRRKPIPAAELEAWARYLRHVTPLPGVAVPMPSESAIIERVVTPAAPTPAPPAPRTKPKAPRRAALAIGVAPPGLDRATWGRFRAGKITPDRVLDLHGMTKPTAHVAVTALIAGAAAQGLRCVEIVTGHGKRGGGEGVLRREVPFWLNDSPLHALILAVCHPHAANEGALRVLIRRNRP
ncbi:Smr/MutS family protein [Acidiphilium sp.]|uniref:Smr/MutS family protein n=1 Tax=Acidiphilium sp. TaxID=527 RepID=UPI003CFBC793